MPARHPTGTFTPFTSDAIEQTVSARFEEQARRFPEHIAVRAGGTSVTYAQLDDHANRIADAILECGGPEEAPVAICLAKDATAVASLLGVLKAGKVYVMLDPSYGASRLGAIVADTGAPLIVTDETHRDLAGSLAGSGQDVLRVETVPSRGFADRAPARAPDRPALISYTSGSSGIPKGVVDTHRNVLYHVMAFANALGICPDDRLTLLHSLSVRAAEMHAFGALLNGGTLCLFDVAEAGVERLGAWLRDERITIYHSLPAIFRELVAPLGTERPWPDLRVVQLSSAPVTPRDVELCRAHGGPRCVFMHRIGSTEAQTIRFHLIERDAPLPAGTVPLGYQVEDTEVLIWDEEGRALPAGASGEIVIKSRYLSPGYWNRPELSAQAFVPALDGSGARLYRTGDVGLLSADGCLELLGRRDAQVKIRGLKVDPSEIEIALLGTAGVREAAVTARDDTAGPGAVVAYVVLDPGAPPKVGDLRQALRRRLPPHMIPTRFMVLESLPHTANGKIDRKALPAPDRGRPLLDEPLVLPRTPLETLLAGVWQRALDITPLGVHDPFFDLGGDSLIAMRIVGTVRERLGLELPVTVLLEAPTIAEMAIVALADGSARLSPDRVNELLDATE